jgi:lipopolysaccharide/colanic/teichoic acid biosynthesis glycosyltransferase
MRRRFVLRTMTADVASGVVASIVGAWLVFGTPNLVTAGPAIGGVVPLALLLVLGGFAGSSLALALSAGSVPQPSYGRAVAVVASGLTVAMAGIVFTRIYWSRSFLLTTVAVWLVLAVGHRWVARQRPWTERLVVISDEKQLVDHIHDAPHADVVAVIDPAHDGEMDPPDPGVTLAVDFKSVLSDRMAGFVSSAIVSGVPVRAFGTVYEEHTGRLPVVHMSEGWELIAPVDRRAPWLFGKRFFDVVLVTVTMPLWLLVWAAGALFVHLAAGSPSVFVQTRTGYRGRTFTLIKLRTMVHDAEANGPRFAAPDDERIIRGGGALRRYRIDEVPQLWNVLRGDLSLVGPRPEQVAFAEEFSDTIPFYSHRHLVRPGVTGWAQINYGYADGEADTVEKLTFDLYYVKHMSPWLDLEILTRSLGTVLTGKGAR